MKLLPLAAVALLVCSLAGALACGSASSATGLAPITSIVIPAATVTAGKGCGRGTTQVFRYAVVLLTKDDGVALAGATYDCFADALFTQLPPSFSGHYDYVLKVFVYNAASYEAQAADVVAAAAGPDLGRLERLQATWTVDCAASQLADTQVVASCKPVEVAGVGTGAITLPTLSFPEEEDGGTGQIPCGEYTDVAALLRGVTGPAIGPYAASCPNDLVIRDAPAPAHQTIDVELRTGATGATVVARAVCHAETSPGLSVTATCDPVKR